MTKLKLSGGVACKLECVDCSLYTADYILCKALDIAEDILRCGGEPHRIEDTVERICTSYGAQHTDVFALPSLIIAGTRMPDGSYSSQVRRVYQTTNNLYMLDCINRISRDVCSGKVKIDDVDEKIAEAKNSQPFPQWLCYFAAILAAGGFAVFFGGNIFDAVAASIAGIIVTLLNMHKAPFINNMIHTVVVSFLGAVTALALVKVGIGNNPDMIMIGTIMLLIPGLAFGNAVRDLLFGDTVSGLIQLVQAILLAVMVAFGFAVAIMLLGGASR